MKCTPMTVFAVSHVMKNFAHTHNEALQVQNPALALTHGKWDRIIIIFQPGLQGSVAEYKRSPPDSWSLFTSVCNCLLSPSTVYYCLWSRFPGESFWSSAWHGLYLILNAARLLVKVEFKTSGLFNAQSVAGQPEKPKARTQQSCGRNILPQRIRYQLWKVETKLKANDDIDSDFLNSIDSDFFQSLPSHESSCQKFTPQCFQVTRFCSKACWNVENEIRHVLGWSLPRHERLLAFNVSRNFVTWFQMMLNPISAWFAARWKREPHFAIQLVATKNGTVCHWVWIWIALSHKSHELECDWLSHEHEFEVDMPAAINQAACAFFHPLQFINPGPQDHHKI